MSVFGLSDEEKAKIREQHKKLEDVEKQKKDDLKKGVAFKPKEKEEKV